MAKIVKAQGETFEFSFTSTEKFVITPEGVTVPDEVASVMENRFAVTIEEAPAASETAPAEEAPAETVTKNPEAPVEVPPVEPTSTDAPADAEAQN